MHLNKDVDDGEEFSVINLAPQNNKVVSKKTETDKYLEEKVAMEKDIQKEKIASKITKRKKHKLEKIQKKYKDQDEDEREIRLALLGSAGAPKIKKGTVPEKLPPRPAPQPKRPDPESVNKEQEEEEDFEDPTMEGGQDETLIIDSLISNPVSEDTLLFATATCAPYSAMQKFKFKVKVTPGTGKRGKAVKTALALFLRSKTLNQAERVLIKNLGMDDCTSQCIPSKVRISAPMLNYKGK